MRQLSDGAGSSFEDDRIPVRNPTARRRRPGDGRATECRS